MIHNDVAPYYSYNVAEEANCPICLDPIKNTVSVAHKGSGQLHALHRSCAKTAAKFSDKCPICREAIDVDSIFDWKDKAIYKMKLVSKNLCLEAGEIAMGSIGETEALAIGIINPIKETVGSFAMLAVGTLAAIVGQSIVAGIGGLATLVESGVTIGLIAMPLATLGEMRASIVTAAIVGESIMGATIGASMEASVGTPGSIVGSVVGSAVGGLAGIFQRRMILRLEY